MSLHQRRISVGNKHIMHGLRTWMTDIIFISHNQKGLKGKLKCQQSCLPRCVQTWPSLQKAVDIWVSGLFSKDMDIPFLNKSLLVFNNLYSRNVPSHKELAFRIDQNFSILLEEIDQFGLFDHTNAFVAKEFITWWAQQWGDISSEQCLFLPSKLCSFK